MKNYIKFINMLKDVKTYAFALTSFAIFLVIFNSCENSALLPVPESVQTTPLTSYTMEDLEKIASDLEK